MCVNIISWKSVHSISMDSSIFKTEFSSILQCGTISVRFLGFVYPDLAKLQLFCLTKEESCMIQKATIQIYLRHLHSEHFLFQNPAFLRYIWLRKLNHTCPRLTKVHRAKGHQIA